jgi:acetyltransferase-like isoleucine patch superfamily enzyme
MRSSAQRSALKSCDGTTRDAGVQAESSSISLALEQRLPTSSGSLGTYFKENGWLLLGRKLCEVAHRRTRDRILGHELRTVELRLGRQPKLRGLRHMRIGSRFSAGDQLWLEAIASFAGNAHQPFLTIGRDVNFSDSVHVACINRVVIGDGVLAGSKVIITDHNHGSYVGAVQTSPEQRPALRPLFSHRRVIVGDNVWLGDGVAVLPGAEIGRGAIIGANSVVNGLIPALCIAVGAPARPIRQWDAQVQQWKKI